VNDKPPSILGGVGIAQNLNAQLPLSLTFTDDQGKQVELGSYFGRKRRSWRWFTTSAHALLGGVERADRRFCRWWTRLRARTSRNCRQHRSQRRHGSGRGQEAQLCQAVWTSGDRSGLAFHDRHTGQHRRAHQGGGFGYVKIPGPDGKLTQFAHASAIQIVTPEGKLAQYYMGVEYSPKDLRLGLAEASSNRIGSPVDNILTYCYHYDPQTNKHSLIVARVCSWAVW